MYYFVTRISRNLRHKEHFQRRAPFNAIYLRARKILIVFSYICMKFIANLWRRAGQDVCEITTLYTDNMLIAVMRSRKIKEKQSKGKGN